MANISTRDHSLCFCCRKTTQTTPEVISDGPSETYPLVSLVALRKLADWYHVYHSTRQGGQPCAAVAPDQPPPAPSSSQPSANPAADLGDAPRRAPSQDPPDAQSYR